MADLLDLQHLAIATAIGFLIGFEREWRRNEDAKTRSFAGARTFALVGLVGGLAGLLGEGLLLLAVGLGAVAALALAAYWAEARAKPGAGATTEIALLGAYLLGATATTGQPALAAAAGVGVAILLALKPRIAGLAKAMDQREIGAALRFLAISVIILPILPNEGYGPYEALNPRQIWQLVVLISGLSFLGYWLAKLRGEHGVLLTGIVGGLASSTAATLAIARLAREGVAAPRAGAAGIVAANVVMLARVGALLFVISREALAIVWPALLAAFVVGLAAAILFWRGKKSAPVNVALGNPMELRPALFFAGLLAVISVASRFATDRFGDSGLYAVAAVTGLADVDALTLTAGDQAAKGAIPALTAGAAILLAVAANILLKGAMAWAVGGRAAGARVGAAFAAVVAAGAGAFLLLGFG